MTGAFLKETPSLVWNVKTVQIVKLFRNFTNASKHDHIVILEHDCRVAISGSELHRIMSFKLGPYLTLQIEQPNVI